MLMKRIYQIVCVVAEINNMMIEITIPISNNDYNDYTNSSINHDAFLRKLGK